LSAVSRTASTLFVLFSVACSIGRPAPTCPSDSGRPVTHHPPVDYFPEGRLGAYLAYPQNDVKISAELDDARRYDLAKALWAMGEPSLLSSSGSTSGVEAPDAYRMLIYPGGVSGPLAIRVEQRRDGVRLTWVRMVGLPTPESERAKDAPNTAEPPLPRHCGARTLSNDEWRSIRNCFDRASFWNMPTDELRLASTGGDSWVLEGATNEKYHFIVRWAPETDASNRKLEQIVACGRMLKGLAGL
jgi:hypothetical protein